jgi:hypothetical protein
MNRIRKVKHSEYSFYFIDDEAKRKYGRIMGGLCFPAHKPGFVVVAAEDFDYNRVMRTHPIHVIDEYVDTDMQGLLRKCLEFSNIYKVEFFVGDEENKPAMDYVDRFCRDLRDNPIQITSGESFEFSLNVCKARLKGQTLHIPEKSSLKAVLWEVPVSDVQKGNPYDYPRAAALGWVVSYLDTYKRPQYEPPDDDVREEDYNPLYFGLKRRN